MKVEASGKKQCTGVGYNLWIENVHILVCWIRFAVFLLSLFFFIGEKYCYRDKYELWQLLKSYIEYWTIYFLLCIHHLSFVCQTPYNMLTLRTTLYSNRSSWQRQFYILLSRTLEWHYATNFIYTANRKQ